MMPPDFPDREEYIKFVKYLDDLEKQSLQNINKKNKAQENGSDHEEIDTVGYSEDYKKLFISTKKMLREEFPPKFAVLIAPSIEDYKKFFDSMSSEQIEGWLRRAKEIDINNIDTENKISLTNAIKLAETLVTKPSIKLPPTRSNNLKPKHTANYSMAEKYDVNVIASLINENPDNIVNLSPDQKRSIFKEQIPYIMSQSSKPVDDELLWTDLNISPNSSPQDGIYDWNGEVIYWFNDNKELDDIEYNWDDIIYSIFEDDIRYSWNEHIDVMWEWDIRLSSDPTNIYKASDLPEDHGSGIIVASVKELDWDDEVQLPRGLTGTLHDPNW